MTKSKSYKKKVPTHIFTNVPLKLKHVVFETYFPVFKKLYLNSRKKIKRLRESEVVKRFSTFFVDFLKVPYF